MARFHSQRSSLRSWIRSDDWKTHLEEIAAGGMSSVGPLMAMLPAGPAERLRAAIALGETTKAVFCARPEQGRDIVRRLMWRMSEESGNIGWGVPEAYAEIFIRVPTLAKEFHNMLLTTLIDLGFDDNYCDLPKLRVSCYVAVARFGLALPAYRDKVRALLVKGLADEDPACRAMALWGLGQMQPTLLEAPLLRRAASEAPETSCVLTDGDAERDCTLAELASAAVKGCVPMPWAPLA